MKTQNKVSQKVITIRFFVSFFLVLCLPIICFIYFFLQNYKEIYREKIIEQAQNSLTSVGMELERNINSLKRIVSYNSLNAQFSLPYSDVIYRQSNLIDVLQAERSTNSLLQGVHYYVSINEDVIYSDEGIWDFSYFSSINEGMEESAVRERLYNLQRNDGEIWGLTNSVGEKTLQYVFRNSSQEWWIFELSVKSLEQIVDVESAVTILQDADGQQLYATENVEQNQIASASKEYEITFDSPSGAFRLVRLIDEDLLFEELNLWQKLFVLTVLLILLVGGVLILILTRYNESPIRKFVSYCREQVKDIPQELAGFEVFQFAMKSLEEQAVLSEKKQRCNRLLLHLIYGRNCDTAYFRSAMQEEGLFRKTKSYRVILFKSVNAQETDIHRTELYFNLWKESAYEYQMIDIPLQGAAVMIVGMEGTDEYLEQELRKIAEVILENVNEEICFYVGGLYHEWNQISLSYFQALSCSQSNEKEDNGGIVYFQANKKQDKKFKYPKKEIEALYKCLVETDLDGSFEVTERLLEILKSCDEHRFAGVSLYYDILNTYYKAQIKLEIDEESEFLKSDLLEISDRMDAVQMIHQIMEQYRTYVQGVRTRLEGKENRSGQKEEANDKEDIITDILAFIEMNKENGDLSVSMIADRYNMSISLLSHRFKKQTGLNISDYVTERKFSYACELLVHTETSVKEIAYLLGYSASISFIRKFKQQYGMTPMEYRIHNAGGNKQ